MEGTMMGGRAAGALRRAAAAGVALAMALGPAPALAAEAGTNDPVTGEYANATYDEQVGATSAGYTRLYAISRAAGLVVPEGGANASVRVTVPVAFHYVIDANGDVIGSRDYKAMIVNHTVATPVHVSKIAVNEEQGVRILTKDDYDAAEVKSGKMWLSFTPQRGTVSADGSTFAPSGAASADEFGAYVVENANAAGSDPTTTADWDIPAKNGAVAFRGLKGKTGGLTVDTTADRQLGSVRWTIAAGTRAQADARAKLVTVRFNANGGSWSGTPRDDAAYSVEAAADLPDGSGLTPPPDQPYGDGRVATYSFKGWGTSSSGSTVITSTSGLGALSSLGGKVVQLYAIWDQSVS